MEPPRLDQFINVVVGLNHGWIRVLGQIRTFLELAAMRLLLALPSRSHISEESQNLGVVRRRLSQLVQFATQLGGHQVAVRSVLGRIRVHQTHKFLSAGFVALAKAHLLEHRVQAGQQGTVEWIIVGQQRGWRGHLVELFEIIFIRWSCGIVLFQESYLLTTRSKSGYCLLFVILVPL